MPGNPAPAADNPISLRHLLRKRCMVMIQLVHAEGPLAGTRLNEVLNSKAFSDHVGKVVEDAMKDNLVLQTGMWPPGGGTFAKVPKSIFEPSPGMYFDRLKQSLSTARPSMW